MIFPLQDRFEGWRSQPRAGLIRLALLDVDGCLTLGEASPLDFQALSRLQELNLRATREAVVPAIALCTGRPEPYVELLAQAIGSYLPSIWENGAGLYIPTSYSFALHPRLGPEQLAAFDQARRSLSALLIDPGLAYHQPGKESSMSLFPTPGHDLEQVAELARRAVEPLNCHYWVQVGLTCVEVLPVGIDKGAGVRWLLGLIDLAPEHVLGVGDAPGDLKIFKAVGLAATPANGAPAVRAAANFVAPRPASDGVLDILDWCIARNQAAAP